MSPAEAAALTCSNCGVVNTKLGKTNCSAGDAAGPPRPGSCPTSTQGEVIGSALEELRGDSEDARLARVAARVEGLAYRQTEEGPQARWTRVEDTIAFARLMGYRKIGIATCLGLLEETARLVAVLEAQGFETHSVCCKAGSTDKTEVGVEDGAKIRPGGFEAACNPIAQAGICNALGTDLNIIMGLCVGHDTLFNKHSDAPVTTLVVKDRVTGHNPAAPLYGGHYYRRLKKPMRVEAEEA
ncbi:MAG: DUF1847 domain-containing protein [Deltaproteobacteria bacterium]|nr:DUF1847 domain-containing protein [Deltaproteobacteria bacterium]